MKVRRYSQEVPGVALSVQVYRFPDCKIGFAVELWRRAYFFELV